jgi:CRISPR-associated protein Csd2
MKKNKSIPYTNPERPMAFLLLFDVTNGNPNGDPDGGNAPRTLASGHGYVTPFALKRKTRNHVEIVAKEEMFISPSESLNGKKEAVALSLEETVTPTEAKGKLPIKRLTDAMTQKYYDNRMYGAVLSTGTGEEKFNAGRVRGALQITKGQSVDPVHTEDAGLTRMARTTAERQESGEVEMGRYAFVPYGLYVARGYYSPHDGRRNGVTREDLTHMIDALSNLFEFDRSSARPEMSVRGLYVFSCATERSPDDMRKLYEKSIFVKRRDGIEEASAFADYEITIDTSALPSEITLHALVDDAGAAA